MTATLPTFDDHGRSGREPVDLLPRWHLAVLAVHRVTVDWRSRAVVLRVPDAVGRVLLDDHVLSCQQVDRPDSAPADTLAELSSGNRAEDGLGLGLLDDGPVADRRLVGPNEAKALDATEAGDQLYLVHTQTGVEVVYLDAIAARADSEWRGVVLVGADNLPAAMIEPWRREVTSRSADERFDLLGARAGEHELVRFADRGTRDVETLLRTLAIARCAPDLRMISTPDGRSPRWPVWRALLAAERLDLTPFTSPQEQGHRRTSGLGLPLFVLAQAQFYTTNAHVDYGKGHSLYCGHARPRSGLDKGYDLFTVADLAKLGETDWCSKCGGYAVRRLDDRQLEYYRSSHRLLSISEELDRQLDEAALDHLRGDLEEVADLEFDPDEGCSPPMQQWWEALRALRRIIDTYR
ncbi:MULTISPECIES: hypothetical protein [Saccharothrix]|uniref:hypothetical protein n=1 Tax=Saccharothrix TaxID=2071 RepID=UPI00093DD470|nr:hypothetical protein [Saccharothrix sp. CB00851]OKI28642.1 hypothetical protein A6A25_31020 [Saccharothrix sp. CB00851]